MRFLHTGDLHIGKKMGARSLIEDQKDILRQIVRIGKQNQVDALFISGDVYDRSVPPEEAVRLFHAFLEEITQEHIAVCIIPGNHDSSDRLSFGNSFFAASHIYIAGSYRGTIDKISFSDEIEVYLLPHLKLQAVREYFPNENLTTLSDAVRTVVNSIPLNPAKVNIILAHQFVVGGEEKPVVSDSETHYIGNSEEISASIFSSFAYTALGHLHSPQQIGSPLIRYSGSPLMYSASEIGREKSVTLIEVLADHTVSTTLIPLHPLHPVRQVRGKLDELSIDPGNCDDYVYVVLTDDIPDLKTQEKVARVYPNYVEIRRELITDTVTVVPPGEVNTQNPETLFADFYRKQYGEPLSSSQEKYVHTVFAELAEVRGSDS